MVRGDKCTETVILSGAMEVPHGEERLGVKGGNLTHVRTYHESSRRFGYPGYFGATKSVGTVVPDSGQGIWVRSRDTGIPPLRCT